MCAGVAAWALAVGVAGEDVAAEGVAVGGVVSPLVGCASGLFVGSCAGLASAGFVGELAASWAWVWWAGWHVRCASVCGRPTVVGPT